MRKPRDFNAELKALTEKARQLRGRKVDQLGELVIATGADALPIEQLAGALLASADADAKTKEVWRQRGAAFFRKAGGAAGRDDGHAREPAPGGDSA